MFMLVVLLVNWVWLKEETRGFRGTQHKALLWIRDDRWGAAELRVVLPWVKSANGARARRKTGPSDPEQRHRLAEAGRAGV